MSVTYGALDQISILRSAVTTVFPTIKIKLSLWPADKYLDLSDVSKVAIASLQLGAVLVDPSISPTSSASSAPVSVTSSSIQWSLPPAGNRQQSWSSCCLSSLNSSVLRSIKSLPCFYYLSICRSASCYRSPVLLFCRSTSVLSAATAPGTLQCLRLYQG